MIPRFLQLHGVTKVNRHEMIWRVKEALLRAGADILDFQAFSDKAVCINFEVTAGNLENLYSLLVQEAFLYQESLELLAETSDRLSRIGEPGKAKNVLGALNITFVQNEPDR